VGGRSSCVGICRFRSGGFEKPESGRKSDSERFPVSQFFHDRLVCFPAKEVGRESSSGVGRLRLAEPLDELEDCAWSLAELS